MHNKGNASEWRETWYICKVLWNTGKSYNRDISWSFLLQKFFIEINREKEETTTGKHSLIHIPIFRVSLALVHIHITWTDRTGRNNGGMKEYHLQGKRGERESQQQSLTTIATDPIQYSLDHNGAHYEKHPCPQMRISTQVKPTTYVHTYAALPLTPLDGGERWSYGLRNKWRERRNGTHGIIDFERCSQSVGWFPLEY